MDRYKKIFCTIIICTYLFCLLHQQIFRGLLPRSFLLLRDFLLHLCQLEKQYQIEYNYILIDMYNKNVLHINMYIFIINQLILPSSAPDANFFPSSPSSSSSLSSTGNTQYQIDISYKCCRLIDIGTIIIIYSYL